MMVMISMEMDVIQIVRYQMMFLSVEMGSLIQVRSVMDRDKRSVLLERYVLLVNAHEALLLNVVLVTSPLSMILMMQVIV